MANRISTTHLISSQRKSFLPIPLFFLWSSIRFGGGFGRANSGGSQMQQNKGPDLEIELEVTLKDLYLGRVIDVCDPLPI